jgi:hypothetical protein
MGSKGDFDKIWRAVAPLREFDALMPKSNYERIQHLLQMHAR